MIQKAVVRLFFSAKGTAFLALPTAPFVNPECAPSESFLTAEVVMPSKDTPRPLKKTSIFRCFSMPNKQKPAKAVGPCRFLLSL